MYIFAVSRRWFRIPSGESLIDGKMCRDHYVRAGQPERIAKYED